MLYGKSGWNAVYGSISGKVTSSLGQGVSMASVVALPMTGQPVSALTNPDGTYEIDGVPPGQYLLYVHPLPPDADIRNPQDANGQAFAASKPFETLFYLGTRDLHGGDRTFGPGGRGDREPQFHGATASGGARV